MRGDLTPNPCFRALAERGIGRLEYALEREILRSAQDDTKMRAISRVILSESCCSEESRAERQRRRLRVEMNEGVAPGFFAPTASALNDTKPRIA